MYLLDGRLVKIIPFKQDVAKRCLFAGRVAVGGGGGLQRMAEWRGWGDTTADYRMARMGGFWIYDLRFWIGMKT